MLEYARDQKRKAFYDQTKELEARLKKIRDKEQRQRLRSKNGEPRYKRVVCFLNDILYFHVNPIAEGREGQYGWRRV